MFEKCKNWVKENPHCLLLLYVVPYLIWFFGLEQFSTPKYWIVCPLDDLIPFNEYFIVPYVLWYLYFVGALFYFAYKNRESFLKLAFVMFSGMTISLIIYTFWPNAIDLRAEIVGDSIFCKLAELLRSVDTPTNVCPSIHCSSTLAVHWAVMNYGGFKHPKLTKAASGILAVLICMSTVFLKQHSIVDVFWGLALTLALIAVVKLYERRKGRFPRKAGAGDLNQSASCDKL